MYEQLYGFYDSPFNITPDPRFLFFSGRHQEAFGHPISGEQLLQIIVEEFGLTPRDSDRIYRYSCGELEGKAP